MKQKDTIDYLIDYWWLIVATLMYIGLKGRIGIFTADGALMLYMAIIFGFTFIKLGFAGLKNASPQLIANNIHTSISGKWYPIGNYMIVKMGGIDAVEIRTDSFTNGTMVFPDSAINTIGSNIGVTVRVAEVDLEELPAEVREQINPLGCKPPYYFGLADEIMELQNPDIIFLETEIKNQNKAIDKRDLIIKSQAKILEDVMSHRSRLSSIEKRESIIDRMKGSFTKDNTQQW